MAIYVTKTASIGVAGVDLSAYVKQVTLDTGNEAVDLTAMGNNTRLYGSGMRTVSISVDFLQDFAASKVDATISAAMLANTTIQINIMPAGTTASATNPRYWCLCIVESYTALSGNVGEAGTAKATFKPTGDLTRATSGAITATGGT
jgi:hypothetical protein